ncbi:YczE/YyaS/YitT family protein [Ectobacillus ponti]|uniref:YczE/YyaS/YitT family protein n=1 Tax=Ectobacillus ponti TaxID=2961894 RepID=UPI003F67BB1B
MNFSLYTFGILLLALGVSLSIRSHLGTSPFDALLVGLSREIGLTVGSWEFLLALLLILCNALFTKKRPQFLGLLTAAITGFCIDMWLLLLEHVLLPEQLISRILCLGAGLLITGLGTALYLHTNFAPIPIDHFTLIVRNWMKGNVLLARTFVYVLFLALAFLFHGPIGAGTVATVAFGGLILSYFMGAVDRKLGQPAVPSKNHAL